jgi:gamma-polyglutamate biosynthesis protein CapA
MEDEVILMAVGDVMLGRNVGNIMQEKGWNCLFEHVTPIFKSSDLIFGNLETPVSNHEIVNKTKVKGYPTLKASPESVQSLVEAGFNVLSLANNHTMDFGEKALFDTIEILGKNGINYIGAAKNESEARKSFIANCNDVRIAFLAYSCSYPASKNRPGCAPIRLSVIKNDVSKARKIADMVVVSLHHGLEYSDYPVPEHITLAHKIIDSGANLILGHHPHVLQGIEYYNSGVIAYSLGNFVHDMTNQEKRKEFFDKSALSKLGGIKFNLDDKRPVESIIFKCILTKTEIKSIDPIPILINQDCQPTILEGEEGQLLLNRLNLISSKIKDKDMPIWKILTKVNAKENVISLFKRDPLYVIKKIHKIRYKHISLFLNYLLSNKKRSTRE